MIALESGRKFCDILRKLLFILLFLTWVISYRRRWYLWRKRNDEESDWMPFFYVCSLYLLFPHFLWVKLYYSSCHTQLSSYETNITRDIELKHRAYFGKRRERNTSKDTRGKSRTSIAATARSFMKRQERERERVKAIKRGGKKWREGQEALYTDLHTKLMQFDTRILWVCQVKSGEFEQRRGLFHNLLLSSLVFHSHSFTRFIHWFTRQLIHACFPVCCWFQFLVSLDSSSLLLNQILNMPLPILAKWRRSSRDSSFSGLYNRL